MGVNEYIQVGTRIKEIRKSKRYTQREVADLLNMPYSTYSNYENNNREPSLAVICRIAQCLHVKLTDILSGEEKIVNDHGRRYLTDHNYRICEVVSENNYVLYNGLFHGFYARSEVLPPSPLRGGHAGGVVADVIALVEDTNGVCRPVPAHRINFIDGLASEILLGKGKEGGDLSGS